MNPALTDPDLARAVGPTIDELCALPLADRLRLVRELTEQVAALHGSGRIHRAIDRVAVVSGENPRLRLPDPPPRRRFGRDYSDPEFCPPELAAADALELPDDVDVAARLLQKSGHGLDPRQIDLYQLGALLCRLLTGDSIRSYMVSPTTKAKVPAAAREVLARAVGFDTDNRFDDSAALMAAVEASERQASSWPAPDADTRPDGRALVRGDDTPVEHDDRDSMIREPADALPFRRLGKFEIVAHLGHGGMGDVYKGYDETLRRSVAVKVLPMELARDAKFVERFHAEATAVARLDHPNVVSIHCTGEEAGYHYFAMQYVEGESLACRLRRRERLSVEETLDVGGQCLKGLQAAHDEGLVHRDIKPSNILIERDTGRVVLVDFGLVRVIDAVSRITSAGTVLGTVDYIAPEQARGERADGRADLYSIGILMYQLLSGELPFSAETPTGMLYQHTHTTARPLCELAPETPAELEAIVQRLMAKEPDDRYQTAAEALEALESLRMSEEGGTDRPVPPRRAKRRLTRPWALASASVLVVALALLATLTGSLSWLAGSPAEAPGLVLAPGDELPRNQWVDALRYVSQRIDPEWHVVSGEWRWTDEGLTTEPSIMSRVMLPVEIDGDYDLRAELTRMTGEGSISIILPVGRRQCQLFFAGWWQSVHGVGRIDGAEPYDPNNPARWKPGKLTNERRYRVEVSVRTANDEATINASLDGQPIIAWSGKQNSLSIAPYMGLPYPKRSSIGAYDSTVTFHAVSLRSVSGKARLLPRPTPPFEEGPEDDWTELLAEVDLTRDVVSGRWYESEGAVAVAPGALKENYMRLMLPQLVEGSYDLVAEFTRIKGSDSVTVTLPVGQKACTLHCSACVGGISGLERIDGKNIVNSHNPAIRRPGSLVNGVRHKVSASVRRLAQGGLDEPDVLVDVWLDGKPYIRWSGRESTLSLDAWKLPEPRHVGVGANVSVVTFHSVRLRRIPD